jgi:hypothetical protein
MTIWAWPGAVEVARQAVVKALDGGRGYSGKWAWLAGGNGRGLMGQWLRGPRVKLALSNSS